MSLIRRQHGVTEKFEGCHIMVIEGYVVEGHAAGLSNQEAAGRTPKDKGHRRCQGCRRDHRE